MKSESDPITDDEWLLRRVLQKFFPKPPERPLFDMMAFRPVTQGRRRDSDGISLYRAACLSTPEDIFAAVDPRKKDAYGIVRVSVLYLRSLNLSVKSQPDPQIKGHVVIPEINADAYEQNKATILRIIEKLCQEVTKEENIVRKPKVAI